MDPGFTNVVSSLMGDVIADGTAPPDYCVDCVYDPSTSRFFVERIGPESSLAKLYGLSPTSYPALTGHSYDHIVSQAYKRVMNREKSVYDHVMAVFPVGGTMNKWMGYQRVILPHMFPDGRRGVSVVTDFADVEIKLP